MTPVDTRTTPGLSDSHTRTDSTIEPPLVRVSVLGGNTQLDVALPAGIPIAGLMGDLIAQIESRNPRHHDPDDPDHPDGGRAHDRRHRWTLALVGQEPLPPNRSLSESGVRDGDLLLLTSTRTGESPVLFDDVVDAVAQLNESQFVNWSPTAARRLGHAVALLAALTASVGLAAQRRVDDALWVVGPGAALALALIVASTIVSRYYRDHTTATVLSVCAMPPAFTAGMLATPGAVGAAHLTLGSAVVLATAILSYRLTAAGAAAHSALTTTSLAGVAICGACLLTSASVAQVAAVSAAVGLLVIGLAPRATIVLAKLPLPPVPTAGAPIDVEDIEPRPTIEGIGAIGAMALPKADALEQRSYIANSYLTGIIAGATAITMAAAVLSATPWLGFDWRTTAYAAIIGSVLCLRGRAHSDLHQAATLIIGGCLIIITLIVAPAFADDRWPIISFALATGVLVAALVCGVVAPGHEFSPVMRRAAEIVEYLLVCTIVPLLLWILDLYNTVRDL